MSTPAPLPAPTTHVFREVGYQLPRVRDDSPLVPDPAFAGLFPKRVTK